MEDMSSAENHVESAQVRRSPRYGVFLIGGALLGFLVAVVLTFAFDDVTKSATTGVTYSQPQVLGFISLGCIPAGMALGGVVALILDRVVGRRVRNVQIERTVVTEYDTEDDALIEATDEIVEDGEPQTAIPADGTTDAAASGEVGDDGRDR